MCGAGARALTGSKRRARRSDATRFLPPQCATPSRGSTGRNNSAIATRPSFRRREVFWRNLRVQPQTVFWGIAVVRLAPRLERVRPEPSSDFRAQTIHSNAERKFTGDRVSKRSPNAAMLARGAGLASDKATVARCPSILQSLHPTHFVAPHVSPPLLAL